MWLLQKPGPRWYSRKEARSLGASHAWTENKAHADKFPTKEDAQAVKDRFHLDDDSQPVKHG